MGVVLLSCITPNENTKARATFCCSPPRRVGDEGRSPAENDSADCSDTTAAPHEYFGYTGGAEAATC
jgi:hypothetical protein